MTDVLIPFGPEVLLLTREQFEAAREAGKAYLQKPEKPLLTSNTSNLLTADELAQRFNIPRSTVYELRKSGRLEAVQMGRHLRFDPEKALASLASLQARPTGTATAGNGVHRG